MKKLILKLVILVCLPVSGFATDKAFEAKAELTNKAFELLVKNRDSLIMTGDISADEKLQPLFDDLGEFISHKLFSVMYDDDEDYTGRIRNFTAACEKLTDRNSTALCKLIIQYKPLDKLLSETALSFHVNLDKDSQPESIVENLVAVSRGD